MPIDFICDGTIPHDDTSFWAYPELFSSLLLEMYRCRCAHHTLCVHTQVPGAVKIVQVVPKGMSQIFLRDPFPLRFCFDELIPQDLS